MKGVIKVKRGLKKLIELVKSTKSLKDPERSKQNQKNDFERKLLP